jgi:hypothetical protein
MGKRVESAFVRPYGSHALMGFALFAAACGDVTQASTQSARVGTVSQALTVSDESADLASSQVTLGPLTCTADPVESGAVATGRQGKQTFRYETFGDEAFWGGQLLLHEAIAGAANGGVGPGVSPQTALSLGLKVDVDALPRDLRRSIAAGHVDLTNPATTLALLKLNAVIGLTGIFDSKGAIESLGIQCALCHTQVDDSFAPGIGHRLDGWPNRDLNVGAIIAAAPTLAPFSSMLGVTDDALRGVLNGWGVGKFDPFVFLDGKATRPDGGSAAVLIPPLFDLQGVGLMTWNGWSGIASWVPLVANLELHGQGVFSDSRLNNATQFPVAAGNHLGRVTHSPDLVTPKLPGLLAYVQSIPAPSPPPGFFDPTKAALGQTLFTAHCTGCHTPPINTLPGWNLVSPTAVGVDTFQADRSPNLGYRPPPLHAIFTQTKGGFFHDGRFATLNDVVAHFNTQFNLALTDDQQADLVEYLKSL